MKEDFNAGFLIWYHVKLPLVIKAYADMNE
jgi:hypothetical protein